MKNSTNLGWDRRRFLRNTGLGTLGLSLASLPRQSFAADNGQVLLTLFLRGGADGMSLLHPRPAVGSQAPSAARQKYEQWRGTNTRIRNGIAVNGRLAMHPALAPLQAAMDRGHAMLIGGVAGAQFNRSHFEQQDLVETGAGPTGAPLADGILGRSLVALGRQDTVLSGISLNTTPPESLKRGASSGLAVPDFRRFGVLRSSGHDSRPFLTLDQRARLLYVPGMGVCRAQDILCQSGQRTAQAISDLDALKTAAELPAQPAASLSELLFDVTDLIAADTQRRFKFLTLDIGGWDTHLNQGFDSENANGFTGTLGANVSRLAQALVSMYDHARGLGIWSRLNVLVLTEFGRTTRENGTQGTDHGYGGVSIVMGRNLARPATAHRYFPDNPNHAFYSEAESTNAVPRSIEHRQIFSEILTDRLGVEDTSTVLPGFTPDAALPRLYA